MIHYAIVKNVNIMSTKSICTNRTNDSLLALKTIIPITVAMLTSFDYSKQLVPCLLIDIVNLPWIAICVL